MPSSNLYHKIFSQNRVLTRKEIEQLKRNQEDAYDSELKASQSPFDADAVEGWEKANFSIDDGMSNLDRKMQGFLKSKFRKESKENLSLIWALILLVLSLMILVIYTLSGNTIHEAQLKSDSPKEEALIPTEAVDLYAAIPQDKQVSSLDLIHALEAQKNRDSTESIDTKNIISNHVEKESEQWIQGDHLNSIQLPIKTQRQIPNTSNNILLYQQADEVYLFNLKNVDYRSYRSQPFKIPRIEVGTPANIGEEGQEVKEEGEIEITYIDYLTETVEYFSLGQYKTALKRYLKILKTYPDDVNANFYGGLCYYNLGQFNTAISHFENAYTLGYGNFREEAMWFSAKANIEQGNEIRARYFLKKIIKEDRFYAPQAEELLKKLESNY